MDETIEKLLWAIVGLAIPYALKAFWETAGVLFRFIYFLPYYFYRDRRRIRMIKFREETQFLNLVRRWREFVVSGRYVESEKERRRKDAYYASLKHLDRF